MSQVIPAAVTYQKRLAETLLLTRQALGAKAAVPAETELLKNVTDLINTIYSLNKEIQARVDAAETIQEAPRKAEALDVRVRPKMDELRECVDALENLIDDELWPLPKFWEMLFIS
jgi:glutamine synthetase